MAEQLNSQAVEALPLTAETIEAQTGFTLQVYYPGFHKEDGYITPDLHDERERLSDKFGEDNVLTSFFSEDNIVKLGLFLRKRK